MRKLLFLPLLFSISVLFGQLPEDALRFGYPLSGGTARNQAIGGAGGSLGGDITSANINPAGIGLYKNKEVVLSPGFNFLNNDFDYRGAVSKSSANAFNYGTSGLVFGRLNRYNTANSTAFSISMNQLANYNNHVEYGGTNNISSWSEQYAEQLVGDRASIADAESNYIFGSSLAYYTYLVDSFSTPQGQAGYFTQTDDIFNNGGSLMQHNVVDTKGGAHELSVAFGTGHLDKFHFGVALGIPFYSYTKDQLYREEDLTNDTDNNFDFFEYTEHYHSRGLGVNAKLGVIIRPIERLRLGFAFHTPTFSAFTDEISSSITANTENYTVYSQPITKTSNELLGNTVAGRYNYQLVTPLRLIASGSWVLREVNDVKQQRGFLTADLEFVNYGGTRYSADANNSTDDDVRYYNNLNAAIKDRYKGALNARIGGEMKFNTWMGRLGFAYLGSPYRDKQLTGSRMLLSGGAGYRNKGFFVDLTYVHALIKDSQVPYYLEQKPNPVADGKNSRGNIVLTFGVKI